MNAGQAQEAQDSLTNQYLITAKAFLHSNKDSSKIFIDKALERSRQTHLEVDLALAFQAKGLWHYRQSLMDTCMHYYDSALYIFQKYREEIKIADVNIDKALVIEKKGDLETSVALMQKSLLTFKKHGLEYRSALCNANIGNAFYRVKAYVQAIKHYQKSLVVFQLAEEATPMDIGGCHLSIGSSYKSLNQYDSALYFLNLALALFQSENNPLAVSYAHNNIGSLYELQSEFEVAAEHYEKSFQIKKEIGYLRDYSKALNNLTSIYTKTGNFEKARTYAQEGFDKALATKDSFLIRDFHKILAELNLELKNYERATSHYQDFVQLNEKVSGVEKLTAIAEIQEKFDNEQKQKKIAELKLEKQQTTNERNLILFGCLVLFIGLGFLFYQNAQRKKVSRLLSDKNIVISKALEDKEILLKEIHHRVKNNLQVISSLLNLQAETLSDESALQAIMDGQNRVKSMSLIHQRLYQENDLRGVDVHDYLKNLIPQLINSFTLEDKEINYRIDVGNMKLDVDTLVPLGLIINELVTNSMKHAFERVDSGMIELKMKEENGQLHVRIQDNGKGLDQSSLEKANSFGWKMIGSLSRKLKAELKILNEGGTVVDILIGRYKLVI